MTCVIFPGQGSQFLGMASDFHDNFKIAKLLFEEIEDHTKIPIRKINGPNNEIGKTLVKPVINQKNISISQ